MSDAEKDCKLCGKPLPSRRLTYHPECRARESERRRCTKCRKIKPRSKFSNDRTRADGKFPWCMECQVKNNTETRFQNPEDELNGHICPLCDTPIRGGGNRRYCSAKCKERCSALRRNYGLSPEQYRALVDATGGRCPICKRKPSSWHVDHNHKTGMTTGVVCSPCNIGALATTNHDIEMVRRLLEYLENTPAERLGIEARGTAPTKPASGLHKRWGWKGGTPAQSAAALPADPPF